MDVGRTSEFIWHDLESLKDSEQKSLIPCYAENRL